MAQFIGKWKGDGSSYTNYDAFAKASGIPDDLVEKFRTATTEMEFKKDGDFMLCDVKTSAGPDKVYKFKSGEEVSTTDPWGKAAKFTITVESDTKMVEVNKSEMMDWKEMKMTREIQGGNKIIETAELPCGTKMTMEFSKV
ncbi:fatty acid-binding protein 1-like [Mytilus galloprovincialis]|uniref:Uncharacterized protein n=1 Tax=Mytilus galloprovincialis TaxID=29158 RepID=A0A8B6BMA1_MYTGA|nr:Hypothetical predicted protein [Mytilus galloprovincialis]